MVAAVKHAPWALGLSSLLGATVASMRRPRIGFVFVFCMRLGLRLSEALRLRLAVVARLLSTGEQDTHGRTYLSPDCSS